MSLPLATAFEKKSPLKVHLLVLELSTISDIPLNVICLKFGILHLAE